MGGPQTQSGRSGKERNSCLCLESNTGHPTRSSISIDWINKYDIYYIINIVLIETSEVVVQKCGKETPWKKELEVNIKIYLL